MTAESENPLPQDFLDKLNSVTNKRARIVIEHILQHGSITTQELRDRYGYNHPPRAAKDVRDEGIPLETFTVKGPDGRSIAAYRFGDVSALVPGREGGRKPIPRKLKRWLYQQYKGQCAVCSGKFSLRELQVDHQIPYEIGGDPEIPEATPNAFMLVRGSCNRAKSWSCEHCPNWTEKNSVICQSCYWAEPLNYQHVATKPVKRTEILWEGEEVALHDKLQMAAEAEQKTIQDYIKSLLKNLRILILPLILLLILGFWVRQINADK